MKVMKVMKNVIDFYLSIYSQISMHVFFFIIIFLQVCKGGGGCGSIQVCMGGEGSVMKVMKVMKKVFLNIVGDVVNNYGENGTRTRS